MQRFFKKGAMRKTEKLRARWVFPALILTLFLFGSIKAGAPFIHLTNENHYSVLEDYRAVDHIAFRTMEIKQSLGKQMNNDSFWRVFFTRDQRIKKDRQNRVRLIYIYLDQWRAGKFGGLYVSRFDKLKLTASDLNKIRGSFSENEQYILESLVSLWMPVQGKSPAHDLWNLSKISPAGYQEFEFLWALLSVERRMFSPFSGFQSIQSMNPRNFPFKKTKNLISKLAKEGFVPAIHLQGFMDLSFDNNPQKAIVKFEKSLKKGYRPDVCSAVLGYLYRRLYPGRPDKAEYYLSSAVYTHGYEIMKGELLDLYSETNNPKAFQVAREIAENFTNFAVPTFLRSMERISFYFYTKEESSEHDLKESYIWMETARIAAMDYGLLRHLPEYGHSRALTEKLSLRERKQLTDRTLRRYYARKEFLSSNDFSKASCHTSFLH